MKKIYSILALLVPLLTYSQHPLEGEWFLHYIETNGIKTYIPNTTNNQPNIIFTSEVSNLTSNLILRGLSTCNEFFGEYTLSDTAEINLASINQTLAVCSDNQVSTFDSNYLSILSDQTPFSYVLSNTNTSLTLTASNGSLLVYGNEVLSTPRFNQQHTKLRISPNPIRSYIDIYTNYPKQQLSYSIYTLSGKRVITKTISNNKINVSQLNTGIYFLSMTSPQIGKRTFKIVKQ
ncbi:T9SS type A sorting domain-containing protein [Aquimarina rhabdastrellae]